MGTLHCMTSIKTTEGLNEIRLAKDYFKFFKAIPYHIKKEKEKKKNQLLSYHRILLLQCILTSNAQAILCRGAVIICK